MNKLCIKLLLIFGLLLCLADVPYWYYQLVHIFGTIGFFYLAYLDYSVKIRITPQLFLVAGIILNPIVKISFGKELWQIIDVLIAILIAASILFQDLPKKKRIVE